MMKLNSKLNSKSTPSNRWLHYLACLSFFFFSLSHSAPGEDLMFEIRNPDGSFRLLTTYPIGGPCGTIDNYIAFDPTPLGRKAAQEIRITNTSSERIVPFNLNFGDNQFSSSVTNALNAGQSTRGYLFYQPRLPLSPEGIDATDLIITRPGPDSTTISRKLCTVGQPAPNPRLYITGAVNSADRWIQPISNNEVPNQFVNRLNFGLFNISASPQPVIRYFRLANASQVSVLQIVQQPQMSGAAEFTITPSSFPLSIGTGSHLDFEIRFTPGATTGVKDAAFQLLTDDLENPTFQFGVTATVTSGTAALALNGTGPDSLSTPVPIVNNQISSVEEITNFGLVNLGESKRLYFRLKNTGFQNIQVTEITTQNTSPGNPIVALHSFIPPFTISPQGDDLGALSARFTPTTIGTFSETVIVRTNGPIPYNEYRFKVFAQSVDLNGPPAPQATFFSYNSFVTLPGSTPFFSASINDTQLSIVHRITNIGGGTLTLSPPAFSGVAASELSTAGFGSPVNLGPLEFVEFSLIADPLATGTRTGSVSVATNTGSPLTFPVQVQGLNRSPDRADVEFVFPFQMTPFLISGQFPGEEPRNRFVSLQNRGRIPLIISSITSSSPFFTIENAPVSIPQYGSGAYPSASFDVVYDPPPNATPTAHTSEISIYTNDPDDPVLRFTARSRLLDPSRFPLIDHVYPGPNENELYVYWHGFEGSQYFFQTSSGLGSWQRLMNSSYGNQRGVVQIFQVPEGDDQLFLRLEKQPE